MHDEDILKFWVYVGTREGACVCVGGGGGVVSIDDIFKFYSGKHNWIVDIISLTLIYFVKSSLDELPLWVDPNSPDTLQEEPMAVTGPTLIL